MFSFFDSMSANHVLYVYIFHSTYNNESLIIMICLFYTTIDLCKGF